MIYQLDEIQKDVRVVIDRNDVSEVLTGFGDSDTLTLDEIIRSKIEDAVRRVETDAPLHLLDTGYNFTDGMSLSWNEDDCSGWGLLPDNPTEDEECFMRLMVFKMSDWERPVYTAITEFSPLYALQKGRFKGLKGTPQKPVVAIVKRAEGLALEFYTCKSTSATVESAVYLPMPRIETVDGAEGIEISERCYRAAVYRCGGLVLHALGDERYQTLIDASAAMLF